MKLTLSETRARFAAFWVNFFMELAILTNVPTLGFQIAQFFTNSSKFFLKGARTPTGALPGAE